MTDAAVSLAIFLAICIGIAFLLLALSNWHRWIDRRWPRRPRKRIDLQEEAANAEHGVTKFRGRHYDAA